MKDQHNEIVHCNLSDCEHVIYQTDDSGPLISQSFLSSYFLIQQYKITFPRFITSCATASPTNGVHTQFALIGNVMPPGLS